MNGGRITIAARSVGLAQAALDDALAYAQEREQFDQPVSEFQTIRHKLADMDTGIQSARYLLHAAADRKMRGERYYRDAKLNEIYWGTSEVLRNTVADQLLE